MQIWRFAVTTSGLALVGAALLCLVSCSGGAGDGTRESKAAFLEDETGEQAPDFTLQSFDGNELTLSDLDGQVRLIDFWATWCAPCREEVPMFKELYEVYGPRGFTILAIAEESADEIRGFVESNEIEYPNLVDPGEVSELYEVPALPSAYLVDREGRIVESFVGPKPRKILEAKIVELLDQPATEG
jgi:peroxiredoxin